MPDENEPKINNLLTNHLRDSLFIANISVQQILKKVDNKILENYFASKLYNHIIESTFYYTENVFKLFTIFYDNTYFP